MPSNSWAGPGEVREEPAVVGVPAAQGAGGMPVDVTSFVGRRRELGEVKHLLSGFRLVTLAGAGGVGKTRLARRVTGEVRRAFQDGVWFVDLTVAGDLDLLGQGVEDPEPLASLIAGELGLRERTGAALRLLADHLAARHQLLVLDNCEHLVPACGVVVTTLLAACPRVRVLATSREALGVSGETIYPVPPLSTPELQHQPGVAELMLYEAVTLFAERAAQADPGFELTQDNHRAVAGICQHLDGVPLAIELAAAWLNTLSPQQILERLADRFALLSRGNRAGPDRQQTLRACVDWSFESCTKRERLLWNRLGVFAGGCELDAIEGVCADAELPEGDLLEVVAGLVDKSVLTRERHDEVTSYRMLETIRDYGVQRLVESGEHDVLRWRHLQWYQQLVVRVRAEWVSDQRGYWLDRLRRARPNLRAAVNFSLGELGEPEEALRLVTNLPWLVWWWGQGVFVEGRRWLERALAKAPAPTALRAQALLLSAELALGQGDTGTAMRLLEEGDQLARRLKDAPAMAHAGNTRGLALVFGGDPQAAVVPLTRARDALSGAQQPDADLLLSVLISLGMAAAQTGDRELADSYRADMVAITGRGPALQQLMWLLSLTSWAKGDSQEASRCAEAFLRFTRGHGISEPSSTGWALEVLAWRAASQGRHRRAATLLGAAETLLADAGTSVAAYPHTNGYHRACEQQSRDTLGHADFNEHVHKGRTASYEDTITYALGEQKAAPATTKQDSPAGLTRRERDVAGLIARGKSNKDIAATLVISRRTAEAHVQHILTKLGFTSRAQVAAWVTACSPTTKPPS